MKARAGTGWQYVMTDLSLILFMITAAALREAPAASPPLALEVPAEGEPLAVWRSGAGAPGLRKWLAETSDDPRLRLTIHAPVAEAVQALNLARESGSPARIVLDPEPASSTYAALTYDRGMAQGLQSQASQQLQVEDSR